MLVHSIFNNQISIQPGDSNNFVTFNPRRVEYLDESDYIWHGYSTETEEFGQILLMSKEESYFGFLNIDLKNYLYSKFEGVDFGFLAEFEEDEEFGLGVCGTTNSLLSISPDLETLETRGFCNNKINVAIFFSKEAEAEREKMIHMSRRNYGYLACEQFNNVASNSQINVRLQLIADNVIRNFNESPGSDMYNDLSRFSSDQDVLLLKSNYGIDLNVLIGKKDNHFTSDGSKLYGRTKNEPPAANKYDAYAMVAIDAALKEFTFAHEIGHLFGGGHNIDGTRVYENALADKWCNSFSRKRYQTVIGNSPDERDDAGRRETFQRIGVFSNPDIEFAPPNCPKDIHSLGSSQMNNSRKLRQEACNVANFELDPIPAYNVWMEGPYQPCINESNGFNISIVPLNNQYQVQWFWSKDGVNYQEIGINYDPWEFTGYVNANAAIILPGRYFESKVLFIRAKGIGPNGATFDIFRVVFPKLCSPDWRQSNDNTFKDNPEVLLFPNPVKGQLFIKLPTIGSPFKHVIKDQMGRAIQNFYSRKNEENLVKQIDLTDLTSGVYFIETHSLLGISISKFIKTN
ncbi:MAG: hypothetical protein IPO14_11440 [Saprospiraceae bacterium]|nr:hypothetical protein [Saprospiraceae bacterium]